MRTLIQSENRSVVSPIMWIVRTILSDAIGSNKCVKATTRREQFEDAEQRRTLQIRDLLCLLMCATSFRGLIVIASECGMPLVNAIAQTSLSSGKLPRQQVL